MNLILCILRATTKKRGIDNASVKILTLVFFIVVLEAVCSCGSLIFFLKRGGLMNQPYLAERTPPRCGLRFLTTISLAPCSFLCNRTNLFLDTEEIKFIGDFSVLGNPKHESNSQKVTDLYEYRLGQRLLDEELLQSFPDATFSYPADSFCTWIVPQLRLPGRGSLLRWGRTSLFYVLGQDETLFEVSALCDWEGKKTIHVWPFNSFEWNPGQHLFSPAPLTQ